MTEPGRCLTLSIGGEQKDRNRTDILTLLSAHATLID